MDTYNPQKTVAILLYDFFEPLDVFGPVEAFGMSFAGSEVETQLFEFRTVAYKKGQIQAGWPNQNGRSTISVQADYSLDDPDLKYDILLVPGGWGTDYLLEGCKDGDPHCDRIDLDDFYKKLRAACAKAAIVASVCTGAGLLAKMGLLDGKKATTNKNEWESIIQYGKDVHWQRDARWVSELDEQGTDTTGIITSSGVSAGIDMTFGLIKILYGPYVPDNSATRMEYIRNKVAAYDPFS